MKLNEINWKKLIAAIIICQLAGILGSVFTTPNIATWYNLLITPDFTPPGSFIGAVWIVLYTLMGISLYIVWQMGVNEKTKGPLTVFGVQLVLNSIWSFLFFGLQSPLSGLIGIVLLWLSIVFTIVKFYKISRNAAYLLIPYILWVSFAAFLNFTIWQLN